MRVVGADTANDCTQLHSRKHQLIDALNPNQVYYRGVLQVRNRPQSLVNAMVLFFAASSHGRRHKFETCTAHQIF